MYFSRVLNTNPFIHERDGVYLSPAIIGCGFLPESKQITTNWSIKD
jgi:hypothetical protein